MTDEAYNLDIRKQNLVVYLIIITLAVLILPQGVRVLQGNDFMMGSEPYYHAKIAEELVNEKQLNFFAAPEISEDRTFLSRDPIVTPYHFILAYLTGVMSVVLASKLLPFVLGLLSVVFFRLVLKKFPLENFERNIALIILVINPAFIYTFSVSNPHAAAILFSLIGFYLFLCRSKICFIGALVSFAIVSLFSIFNTVLVIFLLLAYVLQSKTKQGAFIITMFLMSTISLSRHTSFFYNYTFSPDSNFLGMVLSDLGGVLGFGIFSVILAVFGIAFYWGEKKEFFMYFLLGILLAATLLFIGNIANMYLNFFVAVAASMGVLKLVEREWKISVIKSLTVLVLICGSLFSALSYSSRLVSAEPDITTVNSIEWVRDNAFKDKYLLTHSSRGFWLESIGEMPVITDSFSSSNYNQQFLYKVSDSIFSSRDIKEVVPFIEKYEIQYIYIDNDMKEGLVWSKEDEGLRFILSHSSRFEQIYDEGGVEIWEVLEPTSS